jgi:hypothetical protein
MGRPLHSAIAAEDVETEWGAIRRPRAAAGRNLARVRRAQQLRDDCSRLVWVWAPAPGTSNVHCRPLLSPPRARGALGSSGWLCGRRMGVGAKNLARLCSTPGRLPAIAVGDARFDRVADRSGQPARAGGAAMTRCVVHRSCTNAGQWGRMGADGGGHVRMARARWRVQIRMISDSLGPVRTVSGLLLTARFTVRVRAPELLFEFRWVRILSDQLAPHRPLRTCVRIGPRF